jgi:hypothetical protein
LSSASQLCHHHTTKIDMAAEHRALLIQDVLQHTVEHFVANKKVFSLQGTTNSTAHTVWASDALLASYWVNDILPTLSKPTSTFCLATGSRFCVRALFVKAAMLNDTPCFSLQAHALDLAGTHCFETDAHFAVLGSALAVDIMPLTWQRLAQPDAATSPTPDSLALELLGTTHILAGDVLYCGADLHAALRCIAALLTLCPPTAVCLLGYEVRSANKSLSRLLPAHGLQATAVHVSPHAVSTATQALHTLQEAGCAAQSSHVQEVLLLQLTLLA